VILVEQINIFSYLIDLFLSIELGALLITVGTIIYSPTGNRIGKYLVIIGFFIFGINALKII